MRFGCVSTVSALLEAGANVNVVNAHGLVPLHFAVVGGHKMIIEMLLFHGADFDAGCCN